MVLSIQYLIFFNFFFEGVGGTKCPFFFISDLLNNQGELLSFNERVTLKGATFCIRDFNKVIKSIPIILKCLIRVHLCYPSLSNHRPIFSMNGTHILDKKCKLFFFFFTAFSVDVKCLFASFNNNMSKPLNAKASKMYNILKAITLKMSFFCCDISCVPLLQYVPIVVICCTYVFDATGKKKKERKDQKMAVPALSFNCH